MEFPTDLIHQLQTAFRKEAGIPSYDPTLGDLPSMPEAIQGLDPCPPYLQCKQCRGKLLRGLQSIVCIFCGAQQQTQIPPDPIPFKSTIGCSWLLQSLDLDGSEVVETSGSNKGQTASKDIMVLSDLLNIELKWPVQSEKVETDVANKALNPAKNPLNLAGVDLDNFFSETKKENDRSVSEQQFILDKPVNVTDTRPPGHGSFSLFENTQSFETLARSTDGAADDPSSGWEAEFQSAGIRTLPVDSKAPELVPVSSPMIFSSPLEAGFGSETEMKFEFAGIDKNVKENYPPVSQVSLSDSWNHDDQWHTSSTESSSKTALFEMKSEAIKDGESKEKSNNLPSTDNNLFQNDLWLPTTEKSKENEEPFDDWQDFTSSVNTPGPFPSSADHSSITKKSRDELAPQKNLGSQSNKFQEMELGSLMPIDLLPENTSLHNGSTFVNNVKESSYTDRFVEVNTGETKSTENSKRSLDATVLSDSADNTVETLMSQMHDLSFMLESNLSIPQKEDYAGSKF